MPWCEVPSSPTSPARSTARSDRQVVLADVVDRLVEGPLEERRVQRHDRAHPADRQTAGHRDRVLLGDADVVEPVRERRLELGQARAGGHAGGDRHDPLVCPRELDQLGHEDRRVARVLRGGARGRRRREGVAVRAGAVRAAGPDPLRLVGRRSAARAPVPSNASVCGREVHRRQRGAVERDLVGLGRPVAAALLGPDVDDRPGPSARGPARTSRGAHGCRGRARRRCT